MASESFVEGEVEAVVECTAGGVGETVQHRPVAIGVEDAFHDRHHPTGQAQCRDMFDQLDIPPAGLVALTDNLPSHYILTDDRAVAVLEATLEAGGDGRFARRGITADDDQRSHRAAAGWRTVSSLRMKRGRWGSVL